jgi:hypothetical protein
MTCNDRKISSNSRKYKYAVMAMVVRGCTAAQPRREPSATLTCASPGRDETLGPHPPRVASFFLAKFACKVCVSVSSSVCDAVP